MTKQEFVEKAQEYNYDDDGINGLLELYEEIKELDAEFDYSEIELIQQAVY